MSGNVRPESMERITNFELANKFIDEQVAAVREQVGDKKVLLALSGGVDSSVVAALLIKAIGKQLVCVHVNHGLMRKDESEGVIKMFKDGLDANLIYVDATDHFLGLQADVPARSSFGKKTTSAIFKIFVGMTISDTQTGLRAISREDLEYIATIPGDRFEYETNMLLGMKQQGIPFDEVKIRTVYIEENKSSHFHPIRDSWRIYKLILRHFFKYTLSSLTSAVVDTGAYTLLTVLLRAFLKDFALTAVAGVGARVISSLLNFYMNKRLVFQSNVSTSKAMLRYYMLAVPQMAAQVLLTQGVYALLGIPDTATGLRTLLYAVVMTVLYIVSFMIQQRWVFAAEKKAKEKV